MKQTVFVTSTGSVAADITIKSLKRMGFRVVGCNIYPQSWVVESCEVDVFYQAPPVSNAELYLEFIKEICTKEKVSLVLPMIDYEIDVLSDNREWFDNNNVTLCINSPETLQVLRNKKLLADYVANNCPDIQSIPTVLLKDIDDLKWPFPIVCKPNSGRSSQGLTYIYSQKEWNAFRENADKEVYIVEPFIDGPRVVVEIVRQPNPHRVIATTRRELLSTPHGCSTTVFVYQDKDLEESCKNLADKLNIIGDVNFEFILDKNGVYHLLECNPRFSAGCEFVCMSGYDYIENHIKCFLGKEIEECHFKHNMVIARKYEEYITAVDVEVPYENTHH